MSRVMRRGTGVLALVGMTMVTALAITRGPEAVTEVEFFRVQDIRIQGERFLTREQVEELMALEPDASIWDDPGPVAQRVRRHALVQDVEIRRRPPATLLVQVTERSPVALLPTPALVPVDREGRQLPVDLTRHRLDLPLLEPRAVAPTDPGAGGTELTPGEVRTLAGEAHRIARTDPGFLSLVSQFAADPWGGVLIRLEEPRVTLHYRPEASTHRLREGLRALADAAQRRPGQTVTLVDLRYDDQVVVRFATSNGS